jgi:uncharacterized protein (TIGR03437 family)
MAPRICRTVSIGLTIAAALSAAGSAPVTVILTSSTSSPVFGSPTTLTATLSPPAASGKVTFFDVTSILGSSALTGGHAALTTNLLPCGLRTLRAYYGGDPTYAPGMSAVLPITVGAAAGKGFAPSVQSSGSASGEPVFAISSADFNGDGVSDLVVASWNTSVAVLLGKGDGTFQAPITFTGNDSGNGAYQSLIVGDFNGDGRPDVVVARNSGSFFSGGNLTVLLGNGDGTFTQGSTYPAGLSPRSMAVADFNGDGAADLAVANFYGVSIFLGNGDGTFQTRSEFPLLSQVSSLAVGDFNADGNADLAVACVDLVAIFTGNGDGTFLAGATYKPGASSVVVADFNGDGKSDLATTGDQLTVFLGNGDATFSLRYATIGRYRSLAVADFNGDGIPDLATSEVAVLLGRGDGRFDLVTSAGCCPEVSGSPAMVVGEFNGDGRADVAVVESSSSSVNVLLSSLELASSTTLVLSPDSSSSGQSVTLTATVSPPDATGMVTFSIVFSSYSQSLGSVPLTNGQAALSIDTLGPGTYGFTAGYAGDVSYAGSSSSKLSRRVGIGTSAVTLSSPANPSPPGQSLILTASVTPPWARGAVSFNDGAVNLGTSSLIAGKASIALSDLAIGSHGFTASYSGDTNFTAGVSPVLNVVVNPGITTVTTLGALPPRVTLGRSVTLTASVSPPDAAGSVTFYDGASVLGTAALLGGQASITTNSLPSGLRSIRAYYGGSAAHSPSTSNTSDLTVNALPATGFAPMATYPVNVIPFSSLVADLNGDGVSDLVVISSDNSGQSMALLLGNGDGTFQPAVYYPIVSKPDSAISGVAGDFNGDGKTDLAFSTVSGLMTYLGNGDGTFQPPIVSSGSGFSGVIAVADFNGDGKPDIVASSGLMVFLGNGDGTFTPMSKPTAGSFLFLAVGDFNGDGKADVAAIDFNNNVTILLGNGDGSFQTQATYAANSPSAIAVGDFNGDGKADLVVAGNLPTMDLPNVKGYVGLLLGNGDGTFRLGTDNPANPVSDQSAMVAVGDLNGDGNADLVVSGSQTALYFGHGDGTFDPPVFKHGNTAVSIAVGEFNGDGISDLAILSYGSADVLLGTTSPPATANLSTSVNPSDYSQTVTLTAAVSPVESTGYVTFSDGATVLGNVPIENGYAVMSTNLLTAGTHSLQAVYSGDSSRFSRRSPIVTQVVNHVDPTMTLTSSANPAAVGESIRLAARLSSTAATGSVTFQDGGAAIGSAALVHGTAQLTLSNLAEGSHSISVAYRGDASDSAASALLTQMVNRGTTTSVALTSSANPAMLGQSITLTAILPSDASGAATFYDGKISLGTSPVNNGRAQLSTRTIGFGTRLLHVGYSGDGRYLPAMSPVLSQAVNVSPSNGFLPPNHIGGNSVNGIVQGDFNTDGLTDLAVFRSGNVDVYLSKGDGTFQPAIGNSAGFGLGAYISAAIGDFNNDGIPDLAVTAAGNGLLNVLLGRGDGTFAPPLQYSLGAIPLSPGPPGIFIGDFDADGKVDIVVSTDNYAFVHQLVTGGPRLVMFLGKGDGTFQSPIIKPWLGAYHFAPSPAAVGDFNGDGKLDLAAIVDGYSVAILLGDGGGTFTLAANVVVGNGISSFAVADLNGDGKLDLAVANADHNIVSIVLGNGDGTFQRPVSYQTSPHPNGLVTVDFNGDGKLDLAVASSSGVNVLLGRGDGTFGPAVNYGNAANFVVAGEFNGDGRTDLAIAGDARVDILLGQAESNFAVSTGGVVNAATYATGPFAAGSKAVLWGNFPIDSTVSATSLPLPTELSGFSIQFDNGLRAPIYSVSRGQITFQVPWELAEQAKASFSGAFNGQTSSAQTITLARTSPGIFPGMVLDSSGRPVDTSNPATAGNSVIRIICTGLGVVTNQPATGAPASENPASMTIFDPLVSVGGYYAPMVASKLLPGTVGEYEVDVLVPASSERGSAVPVSIETDDGGSNVVTIAVK